MIWRIDVFPKQKENSSETVSQIKDLGRDGDLEVYRRKVFLLDCDLEAEAVKRIAAEVLTDPVIEDYSLIQGIFDQKPP